MGALVSCGAVLGGCSSAAGGPAAAASGPATAVTSAASQEARSLPQITVERSGGFAGVRDTVAVTAQGAWTTTNRAGSQTGGRLSAAQMAEISALVADPRIAVEAQRTPGQSQCRDAFNYVLTVGTSKVSYVACPADPDQPSASIALVRKVMQFTAPVQT